ncbi:MAG TPA: proton-conducting transporter membrane subunit [Spirochaetia bacterium]|nr:proton-conducting transporter membrane subunit [Spirochaetia bacterium]
MNNYNLVLPVAVPAIAGVIALLLPARRAGLASAIVAVAAGAVQLAVAIVLFPVDSTLSLPWLGYGIEVSLVLSRMSAFILLATAGFGILVSLYASASLVNGQGTSALPAARAKRFHAWVLFTVAMASGAALADNLVLFLVFAEGLLLTQFAMIASGRDRPFSTAIKAFVIVGVSDLAMMLGVMLTGRLAGSLSMSAISVIRLPLDGLGGVAFILLMAGAIGKAGAMPFHSWIPDAAINAPLPFMAILPASIDKLLGIYFLARISLDLFALAPGTWVSTVLMIVGAVTILFAVLMALIQKDYKRLLSYHAISQVGYMVLGVGTAVPAGIVGGLFHMVNHAMYKSCLFLTGGAVEKQAGTTDLEKLGGLFRRMPVTAVCFIVAAASISGVPPFNGFFSKELVYDGALERGWIFYAAALLGSVLTAASFLKLGHAAFFGKPSEAARNVREAPVPMLIPMIVLAGLCILFGVYNVLPLEGLVQPAIGQKVLGGESFAGFPASTALVLLTVAALTIAALNHWYGVRRSGHGLGAADHIHHAPLLGAVYAVAEQGKLDPYTWGRWLTRGAAAALHGIDRGIDWMTDAAAAKSANGVSRLLRSFQNGNVNRYVLWSLVGAAAVVFAAVALIGGGR